jgi:membrane-bound lytic murein transglycosylase B
MHGDDVSRARICAFAGMTVAVAILAGCTTQPTKVPPSPPPSVTAGRSADAPAEADPQQKAFERWVMDFRTSAWTAGIDEVTLNVAFADVRYLLRVIELDRAQPEFTRPVWLYLDSAVSPQRVALGQDKWLQFRADIDAAAVRYGVPPEILVAIWGVESNYGSNFGSIPTVDALATLGFDGRREDWARGQLLAALKILQSGDIERSKMVGSWAGAMGQTQFLPSVFLGYAIDADGDGRRDIWGSMADVMASTANFLARSGWEADHPWSVEVRLPPRFDVGRADLAVRRASAVWADEGVQTIDGAPLPQFTEATVLLPAGAGGPAFLVGPNFQVILRYNNSTSYALAVSLLAQRLSGGPGVQAPWPRDLVPLSRQQLTALQTALNQRGFDSGPPDGVMGPNTRGAIRGYQRSAGLPADGYPTLELLQHLLAQ